MDRTTGEGVAMLFKTDLSGRITESECSVCGCAEADLLVTVGRTASLPTASGGRVEVDVEQERPMCVECFKAKGGNK